MSEDDDWPTDEPNEVQSLNSESPPWWTLKSQTIRSTVVSLTVPIHTYCVGAIITDLNFRTDDTSIRFSSALLGRQ